MREACCRRSRFRKCRKEKLAYDAGGDRDVAASGLVGLEGFPVNNKFKYE